MTVFDPAIAAVPPVDLLSRQASATPSMPPVEGSPSAAGTGSMAGMPPSAAPTLPPPASPEASARFREMLDRATLDVQNHAGSAAAVHKPSAITELVGAQDDLFNQMQAQVQAFESVAPTLSPHEFTAEMVRLQFQLADSMARIELGVALAQGGKGAVQSLMKNQ